MPFAKIKLNKDDQELRVVQADVEMLVVLFRFRIGYRGSTQVNRFQEGVDYRDLLQRRGPGPGAPTAGAEWCMGLRPGCSCGGCQGWWVGDAPGDG